MRCKRRVFVNLCQVNLFFNFFFGIQNLLFWEIVFVFGVFVCRLLGLFYPHGACIICFLPKSFYLFS